MLGSQDYVVNLNKLLTSLGLCCQGGLTKCYEEIFDNIVLVNIEHEKRLLVINNRTSFNTNYFFNNSLAFQLNFRIKRKMKYFFLLVTLTILSKVENFSERFKTNSSNLMFMDILRAMEQQNHEVSIVSFGDVKHKTTELLFCASTAGIPHTVFKLNEME